MDPQQNNNTDNCNTLRRASNVAKKCMVVTFCRSVSFLMICSSKTGMFRARAAANILPGKYD
jgi:hypothetical protein